MDLRFSAAEKFFAKKITLTREDFDALMAEAQVYAFTVARISSIQIIADIQAEVQRAIIEGTTLEDFKKAMPGLMAKHGWSGLTPWHTETVFRTNVQMAYGMGQLEGMTAPHVLEAFPFWQYSAINDGRVRPSHLALDGKVYPADHPFWKIHFPPWGYNCRCDVIPLLPEQLGDRQVHTDSGPPDEGFNGPGHVLQELKNEQSPKKIAKARMPRLTPQQEGALMDKLDADVPLGLKVEGVTAPPPVIDVVPVQGPTIAELEEAHAENAKFDKVAKRKAQIKAAQQKYAAKKAAEKAAAKEAAVAAAKAQKELAEKIDEAHGEALIENAEREAKKAAAAKATKIANLKKTYPLATKDLPDEVIEKHLLAKTAEELEQIEKSIEAHRAAVKAAEKAAREAYVLGPLTKEELAALTPEEKAFRRADQIRRSRENAKKKGRKAKPSALNMQPEPDDGDPFTQLSSVDWKRGGRAGVDFRRNLDSIEGNNVTVRIVEDKQGDRFYEFFGKTNNDDISDYVNKSRDYTAVGKRQYLPHDAAREGAEPWVLRESGPEYSYRQAGKDKMRIVDGVSVRADSRNWTQLAKTSSMANPDDLVSARSFRVRVPYGPDADVHSKLRRAVEGTPLEGILSPAPAAQEWKVGVIRAIRDRMPNVMKMSGEWDAGVSMFDGSTVLKNVTVKELAKMSETQLRNVVKHTVELKTLKLDTLAVRKIEGLGYSTHTIKRGFDYSQTVGFHGAHLDVTRMADNIQRGSVFSSFDRVRYGMATDFNTADNGSGGGESIFMRILTKQSSVGRSFVEGYHGGNFQFILDPVELERLDSFNFYSDLYGDSRPQTFGTRLSMEGLAKENIKKHNPHNEFMLRRGFTLENVRYINCSGADRYRLIAELKARGIDRINGRPVEEFIVSKGATITADIFDVP